MAVRSILGVQDERLADLPRNAAVEKFPEEDLSDLRMELMRAGVDSWQAGEMISSFLSGRGYGVSNDAARSVAASMETVGRTPEAMQEQLERLAYVM